MAARRRDGLTISGERAVRGGGHRVTRCRRAGKGTGGAAVRVAAAGGRAVPGQDRGAELDDGLAQRRHRQRDARGEHRAGERQRGTQHQVTEIPAGPAPAGPPAYTGLEQLGLASGVGCGEGRAGTNLRPDALKAVGTRLHLIRGGMQRRAHKLREVMWLTGWWTGCHVLLLLQRGPERGHAAGRVALDRSAADPHGGGDLSLGEVGVVTQHDCLALPFG
jgi:hypothetical protein